MYVWPLIIIPIGKTRKNEKAWKERAKKSIYFIMSLHAHLCCMAVVLCEYVQIVENKTKHSILIFLVSFEYALCYMAAAEIDDIHVLHTKHISIYESLFIRFSLFFTYHNNRSLNQYFWLKWKYIDTYTHNQQHLLILLLCWISVFVVQRSEPLFIHNILQITITIIRFFFAFVLYFVCALSL